MNIELIGAYLCETCNMDSQAHDYPDFHVAHYPDDEECHAPFTVKGHVRYYNDCGQCESYRRIGITFFPDHKAMSSCESGGHDHCTCDFCW